MINYVHYVMFVLYSIDGAFTLCNASVLYSPDVAFTLCNIFYYIDLMWHSHYTICLCYIVLMWHSVKCACKLLIYIFCCALIVFANVFLI